MPVMKPREIEKDIYIFNGQSLPVSEFDAEAAIHYPAVYEVLKVTDGVPLFWDAHIDRLEKSLILAGVSAEIDKDQLYQQALRLAKENNTTHHNMKIIMNAFDTKPNGDKYLFFITTSYPSPQQLKEGVKVITFDAERHNPNAKIITTDFRTSILEALQQAQGYEALLVNAAGEVTEGSRSNFFVIKDNVFITPPSHQILEGITRQIVINLLERLGYALKVMPLSLGFLMEAESLFLTGTSPGILPIQQANNKSFDVTLKPLKDLQDLYRHVEETYININK